MLVAALGILVNGGTALLFMRGRHGDLNIRGAYLHMAADAGVSLGVVVAACVIMATGWLWVDPAISLVHRRRGARRAAGAWRATASISRSTACREASSLPRSGTISARLEGVTEVHDLHVWAMSTNETALTAHLVRPGGYDDAFLHRVCEELSHRFNIHHATLQIEVSSDACKLAPAEVV